MLEISPEHMTLGHHISAIQHPIAGRSVVNSFKYATVATAIDVVLAFAIAYLLVRVRTRGAALLDGLAMLPLAVPGLVLAFGYFSLTQGDSPVAFLNPLTHDPAPLLIIAYSVRRLPFLVRSVAAGLEQTSEVLEEAAINLGASTPRVLWKVTVPLVTANLIAGGLLVFSRSMLEVSDSLILAFDQKDYPMTKAIWSMASDPTAGLERASALGVWGMLLLTVTIGGASLALGKRLGALFRV
jgi:iron(III) transport system permease protein